MASLIDKLSPLQGVSKKIIRGGGAALANRMLWIPVALYLSVLITNGLGDKEAGIYFFSFSLISVLAYITQFGLPRALVKIVSTHLVRCELGLVRSSIISTFLIILTFSSVILLILEGGLLDYLSSVLSQFNDLKYLGFALGLWILFTALQALASEIFRAFQHPGLTFFFGGLMWRFLLVLALILLGFTDFELNIENMIWLAVFFTGLSSFLGLLIIYNKIKLMPAGEKKSKSYLLKTGSPMMFAGLSGIIITNACILILAIFQPPEMVAKLSIAFRLAALGNVAMTVIGAVIPSYIVKFYEKNKMADLEMLLRLSSSATAFCSLTILILFYFWGKEILVTFFGPSYEQAYYALLIFSVGYFLQAMNGPIHFTLDMIGYHKVVATSAVLCTSINVIGCFIFAPIYGLEGVATVTAVAMTLQLFIMTATLIKKEKINPLAYIFGPSISKNKVS